MQSPTELVLNFAKTKNENKNDNTRKIIQTNIQTGQNPKQMTHHEKKVHLII